MRLHVNVPFEYSDTLCTCMRAHGCVHTRVAPASTHGIPDSLTTTHLGGCSLCDALWLIENERMTS